MKALLIDLHGITHETEIDKADSVGAIIREDSRRQPVTRVFRYHTTASVDGALIPVFFEVEFITLDSLPFEVPCA